MRGLLTFSPHFEKRIKDRLQILSTIKSINQNMRAIETPAQFHRVARAAKEKSSHASNHAAVERYACDEGSIINVDFRVGDLDERTIDATDLAAIIKSVPGRLCFLTLSNVCFLGSLLPFIEALSTCKNLNSFCFSSLALSTLNAEEMTAMGEVLANLPVLKFLSLTPGTDTKEDVRPPWKILAPIFASPNHVLSSLHVSGFAGRGDTAGARTFFDLAAASPTLKDLALRRSDRHLLEGATGLLRMTKSLKSLKLSFSTTAGSPNLLGLAGAMRHNHTLESLEVDRPCYLWDPEYFWLDMDAEAGAFETALQQHGTFSRLQKLRVEPWYPRTSGEFDSPAFNQSLKAIDFHLAVNRTGREYLLSQAEKAPVEAWRDAIANQKDPSVIYFFLRKNPLLCLPDHTCNPRPKDRDSWWDVLAATGRKWWDVLTATGCKHQARCPHHNSSVTSGDGEHQNNLKRRRDNEGENEQSSKEGRPGKAACKK